LKLYLLILCIILAGCKTSQQLAIELDKSINTIVKGVTNPSSIEKKSTIPLQPRRETEPYLQPNKEPEPKDVGTESYSQPNNEPEPKNVENKITSTKSEICRKVQQSDREAILTALNKRIFCKQPEIEIPLEQTEIEIPLEQTEEKAVKPDSSEHSNEEICAGVKMKNREFIKLALMQKLRC
jgi:hypothetical protein